MSLSPSAETLAARLGLTENRTACLFKPLIELLAQGRPVDLERLAAQSGLQPARLQQELAKLPALEWDGQGRIIGAALTLTPTPHRVLIDGQTLYAWCALDTLFLPALLGRRVIVFSPTPGTGELVQVSVAPDRLEQVTPAAAVVSLVPRPAATPDVRAAFCRFVHFFSSSAAAQPWLAQHPQAILVPVAEAFALGQQVAAAITAPSGSTGGCCAQA